MALFFREIQKIVWWDKGREIDEGWLSLAELRGDALRGIATRENELSIFRVEDLDRTIAAYAALRDKLDKIEFAVFDSNVIAGLSLDLEEVPGNTPDDIVNSLHVNVKRLSGAALVQLGLALQASATFDRRLRSEVKDLIVRGIGLKQLDVAKCKPKLREALA